MTTKQFIEKFPNISEETRAALLSAISTRGKWKDCILENAPSATKRPDGWIAWQALISNLAPARVSMWSLMLAKDETTARYNSIDKELTDSGLATAINALEPPYRWNLYAHHHNVETERKALARWLDNKLTAAKE